jgi:hypothetical protein
MIKTANRAIKIYFTEDDYTNDVNYVSIPVSSLYWEAPAEINEVWLVADAAAGAASVELIAFQRRG